MLRFHSTLRLIVCFMGLVVPTIVEAGIIPWTFDALFGPVGSLQSSYYAPYYSGYSGSWGVGYLPAAYSYGYGTNGCSSCQQSSYYQLAYGGCGCSPCGSPCGGGCSTGGCPSGNCVVNSAPSGTLTPTPDNSNGNRKYAPDNFRSRPSNRDQNGGNSDLEDFSEPRRPGGRDGRNPRDEDGNKMFTPNDRSNDEASTLGIPESISTYAAKKENTASDDGSESEASDTPALTGEKSPSPSDESESEVIRARTKAPMAPVEEGPRSTPGKSTLRLDNRVISAAVAPRDRQKIAIGFQNPVATKKKANPAAKWSTKDRSTDLAQHR